MRDAVSHSMLTLATANAAVQSEPADHQHDEMQASQGKYPQARSDAKCGDRHRAHPHPDCLSAVESRMVILFCTMLIVPLVTSLASSLLTLCRVTCSSAASSS